MPEFASPVLSSWLPKRLQHYIFFYSFVPTVLLRLQRAVFGLVRVILVICYSPGPKALRPFPSQLLIHRTAMPKLVPMTLLKSVEEKPGLAVQVMVIYLLLLCTEAYPPAETQICTKGQRKLCCPRTLQLRNCESAFQVLDHPESHCPQMAGKWQGSGNSPLDRYSFSSLKLHLFQ